MSKVSPDRSAGYDAIAPEFMAMRDRAQIGVAVVQAWVARLPAAATVLDLGCGHGIPITRVLIDAGLRVHALDASPAMVAAFRERFPDVPVRCEAVEASDLFERRWNAVVAWGLLFLLPPPVQENVISNVAATLAPGGRFLFTAPWQGVQWRDLLTGRTSVSLGRDRYRTLLERAGLVLEGETEDEGNNHTWFARKLEE